MYKEYGECTDLLSVALHKSGIRKGDHVAVMLPNTHYMLESFYGICQMIALKHCLVFEILLIFIEKGS
ncbi:AMP-binding protein [Actinomycetes bacterium NPDC127524]